MTENAQQEKLSQETGLSIFMLGVLCDMYEARATNKHSVPALTLIDIATPNPNLRAMNSDEIERNRSPLQQQKTADEIRKSILEAHEKKLQTTAVHVACTADSQQEKLPARERDQAMLWEFVGYARTKSDYFIYVYYVGPSDRGPGNAEHRNLTNWLPVHKSHLLLFHRRITRLGEYTKHARQDQPVISAERPMPAYDPRFIVHKWSESKEGKPLKGRVLAQSALFRREEDFLVKHYKARLDVEADRLAQQRCGYVVTDPTLCCSEGRPLCRVTMGQYPELRRRPIPEEVTFSLEELVQVGRRLRPEGGASTGGQWDPLPMMKALIIALNHEAHIKSATTHVFDEHGLILERDNIQPLLDYVLESAECVGEVKKATMELLWATVAADVTSRDLTAHLQSGPACKEDFEMLED